MKIGKMMEVWILHPEYISIGPNFSFMQRNEKSLQFLSRNLSKSVQICYPVCIKLKQKLYHTAKTVMEFNQRIVQTCNRIVQTYQTNRLNMPKESFKHATELFKHAKRIVQTCQKDRSNMPKGSFKHDKRIVQTCQRDSPNT